MAVQADISRTARNPAIDALRGVAVILMVEQHLGFWFWDKTAITASMFSDYPLIVGINSLGGLAAPLFLTISGFCSIRYLDSIRGRHLPIICRGLIILGYGYLLNLIVPSWFTPCSWYVLHIIGLCLVLAVFLNRFSTRKLIPAVFIIISIAALIQICLDTPLYIGNTRMGDCAMNGGVLRLVLAEGHFPVFPWLAFFISGMVACRWHRSGESKKIVTFSAVLISAGLMITVPGVVLPEILSTPTGRIFTLIPNFYPAAPPITLLLMGTALLSLYFVLCVLKKVTLTDTNMLVNLGRISLTVLVLHAFIFRELFLIFGWRNIFGEGATILLIFLIIVAFGFISVIWRKRGFVFSLEWMMRKAVQRAVQS